MNVPLETFKVFPVPTVISDVAIVVPSILPPSIFTVAASRFATNVATVYPVALVLIVLVVDRSSCESINNLNLPLSLASLNKPAYLSVPPESNYYLYQAVLNYHQLVDLLYLHLLKYLQ